MRGPQLLDRSYHVFEIAQTSFVQSGRVGAEGLEVYLKLACELVLLSRDVELCGGLDFSLEDLDLLFLLLVVVFFVVAIVTVSMVVVVVPIVIVSVPVSILPPSLFVPVIPVVAG